VDEKISQLTQKHELLSQYKQGMMQKLFSQQIRFKADDGSEFGEWEEKALKTIAEFMTALIKPLIMLKTVYLSIVWNT
jgi:type I restriction enzyme S subunit